MRAPRWGQHIATDGGPCAWAIEVSDIAAHAARLREAGIPVDGPTYVHRQRPDGVLVEWQLAFVGSEGPGALHPFLIEDRTPKNLRIQVAKSVCDGPLTGVAMVLIAVADLDATTALFQEVYSLPEPASVTCTAIPGSIRVFPGEPLALVSSDDEKSWIGQRIQLYGASPCAFLLRSSDLVSATTRYPFGIADRLGQAEVLWLDNPKIPIGIFATDVV